MNNFLYCFDNNYNIPAACSIYSLLENSIDEINIYILHKNQNNSDFFPKKIVNHPKLKKIKVIKVDLSQIHFPNIFGSHVSEATYYRLFLQDYVTDEIKYITYLDCDVFCIKNPNLLINKTITKMEKSGKIIASNEEPGLFTYGKNTLNIKPNKYFNAGVMVINLELWKLNKLKDEFLKLINQQNEKLLFWDQDVLNLYFNGNYEILPDALNTKVDMEVDNNANTFSEDEMQNLSFLHYSGKFKPWSVRGAINDNSEFFQNIYRQLYNKKYYLNISYKVNAINDLVTAIFNGTLVKSRFPFRLIWYTITSLIIK